MKRLKYLNLFSSLIVLLLIYFNTNAQDVKTKTDSLSISLQKANERIEDLSEEIKFLSEMLDKQTGLIGQEQSAVSNSMSSLNILFVAFSVIIAIIAIIGGVLLGRYVKKKSEQIEKIKDYVDEKQKEVIELEGKVSKAKDYVDEKQKEVIELEEKVSKAKDSVLEIDNKITSDIDGLYENLRRSETKVLLQRLADVPEDINNLFFLLTSRKLYKEDFGRFLVAYRKLKDKNEYAKCFGNYLALFFQHFCGEAVAQEIVRDDLIDYFQRVLNSAFEREVEESTKSLILCLNKNQGTFSNEDVLKKYLSALIQSKYKDYKEPYRIILDNYSNKEELKEICKKLDNKPEVFEDILKGKFGDNNSFALES